MRTILNTRFLRYEGTQSVCRVEIGCDTADELPAVDGIEGMVLAQGSTAHVINDGEFYSLNGSGEWVKQA